MRSLIQDYPNQQGTKVINELFGEKEIFSYAKPVGLIKHLLSAIEKDDEIILDFFSGSSTTAQAVIEFNNENKTNHRFIMVQRPEKTNKRFKAYKSGYSNICEIGEERIRRAGDKIIRETNNNNLDIGFKVFKLNSK
jgi:adenine-specific DNA-methyltransferase